MSGIEILDHEQSCHICMKTVVTGMMKKVVVDHESIYICDDCCFELEHSIDVEVKGTPHD